jgi:hypothetical protein
MPTKDVLFEIQSWSEVKERACYVQNFLVWDRLNVVQIILRVFHFSRSVIRGHTSPHNDFESI